MTLNVWVTYPDAGSAFFVDPEVESSIVPERQGNAILALIFFLAAFVLLVFCGGRAVRAVARLGGAGGMSDEAISRLPSYQHVEEGMEEAILDNRPSKV